jgi:CDP-glycerol glycerophosphotransferase (TagB/SpsB family)
MVAFGTHTGAFAGNVKAMLLDEGAGACRKLFIAKTKELSETARALGIESYWRFSVKGWWYALRSGTYVYSSYPSDIGFWLSGGAKYVNVWHGTPLKKIERDVENGPYALRNRFALLFRLITPYLFVKPDLLLVASAYEKQCFKTAFGVRDETFFEAFPPRLVSSLSDSAAREKKILYVPTWRDDHSFALHEHLDLERVDLFLEQVGWELYVKPHPSDRATHLPKQYLCILPVPKETDVYSVLDESSVLLTDYSSMLFEALYLKKKVMLFCPDYSDYVRRSRTFYLDPCRELDLPVSEDTASLISALETAISEQGGEIELVEPFRPYGVVERLVETIVTKVHNGI